MDKHIIDITPAQEPSSADEELIRQFVSSQLQDIPDNGFTEKVMQKVDIRKMMWVRLLNLITVVGAIAMFYWLGGFNIIATEAHDLRQGIIDWLSSIEVPAITLYNPQWYLQPQYISWLLYPIGFMLILAYLIYDSYSSTSPR